MRERLEAQELGLHHCCFFEGMFPYVSGHGTFLKRVDAVSASSTKQDAPTELRGNSQLLQSKPRTAAADDTNVGAAVHVMVDCAKQAHAA